MLALKRGDARRAVISLREANQLFETWIGQFDLGSRVARGRPVPQADSAFDACLNARRGEALSLFVDEQPTYAYIAPAHYYLGRARQELKSTRLRTRTATTSALRGNSKEDVLLPEVRKRAGPQLAGRASPYKNRRRARVGAGAGVLSRRGLLLFSSAVTDTDAPQPDVARLVGGADPQVVFASIRVAAQPRRGQLHHERESSRARVPLERLCVHHRSGHREREDFVGIGVSLLVFVDDFHS